MGGARWGESRGACRHLRLLSAGLHRAQGSLRGSDRGTRVLGTAQAHPSPFFAGKTWEKVLLRKSVVSDRLQRLLQPKLLK